MNNQSFSTKAVSAFLSLLLVLISLTSCSSVTPAEESSIEQRSRQSLKQLYDESPTAVSLGSKAKGILVFPHVVKAGLVVGGQGGDGVLLINDRVAGYYNTSAVSVGMQAGGQTYGYVLFFMTEAVLRDFQNSKNFQVGMGPNIVVVEAGAAKDITTLTAKSDVYAMIFGQKGLMAGIGLQGAKITKLEQK